MVRQIEIQWVDGLTDILHETLLLDPTSRMVLLTPYMLTNVIAAGDAFIRDAGEQPEHQGQVIYTAYQWPENGPATYAIVWALNTRLANSEVFIQPYTETQTPDDHLVTWEQAERGLALYGLQAMGSPRLVE